jgi:uncharacterized protein (DUF58 family)
LKNTKETAAIEYPRSSIRTSRATNERAAWRTFLVAMFALGIAFALAIYSGVAAEAGSVWTAAAAGLGALGLAGWTAVTTVPALARRTPLRWLAYQVDYRVTRQGLIYLAGVFAVALAALNTGNNLLFLILGCMLAVILLSGILSRITLTGVEVNLELPEHVFAKRPAPAALEIHNLKQTMPSFSLRVQTPRERSDAEGAKADDARAVLTQPVYFPYIARQQSLRQRVELMFPRRGVYRQKALAMRTRFPFGFLEKTRSAPSSAEIVVYPAVEPTDQLYEILPLISGEIESFVRGRGHDLYAIRDMEPGDSARFVDWKATARSGVVKVREFAREDERRVLLALDPLLVQGTSDSSAAAPTAQRFEHAVDLCAAIAWHFHELGSVIGFRAGTTEVPLAPSSENIYDVLRALALVEAQSGSAAADSMKHSGGDFLRELAADTSVFKIVFTGQPRGSIPTALWTSSYLIFTDSL